MANYTGPKCRLCRREGAKLFLKGERCEGQMCAVTRRQVQPGGPTKSRRSSGEYGKQLREKQKVKRSYGLLETQFHRYFEKALSAKGATGEILLSLVERRLDNAAHHLGWGLSRAHARQLIRQGKVDVNGRKVSTPSYSLKTKDVLVFKGSAFEFKKDARVPEWLKAGKSGLVAEVVRLPERKDVSADFEEQLIVEFYSR